MSKAEFRNAELEAQIEFMKKFIVKLQEKNPNIIPPSSEEIEYMRKEAAKKISDDKGVKVIFE